MHDLSAVLLRLEGRNYKGYKEIQGRTYRFPSFRLSVDHVQGDPYAAPSRMRALIPADVAALPSTALASPARRCACRDYLARAFSTAARREPDLGIESGRQTVLDRSACLIGEETVELRFTVDLPGRGRRILGRHAVRLLCEAVPRTVEQAALAANLDLAALERHCAVVEDQVALRTQLVDRGLVAFVANDSSLPRRSGIDDRPAGEATLFAAPPSLAVTLETPNAGEITGLGVPRGITLIVGGGFHGKSTLLKALETGVYDHVPGDGREKVVTEPSAVKIRAEDGRSVAAVDISSFIGELPGGRSTTAFTTDLASGSTSQAAALVEALETGARSLLLDEDTSATNFMIRDERMQALVAKTSEPITPFVDRVGELHSTLGVSTVLVMGGSGDYFDHADTVIQMDHYRPLDVTREAVEVARSHQTGRRAEAAAALVATSPRRLHPKTIRPERKPGRVRVGVRGLDTLILGRDDVDLRAVEQLVDPCQIRVIGWLLARLSEEQQPIEELLPIIEQALEGLEAGEWNAVTGKPDGDLALPRAAEVMAALNRLRGVKME